MTIDEAIEQERKQVEMYRCEYEGDCDYYGKDFIDDYTDELDCIKNMRKHEQLAEWLEELRVYQQHEIICNKGYNNGYNKAIDDFAILIKETLNHDWSTTKISEQIIYNRLFDKCNEIAEQLKEGNVK